MYIHRKRHVKAKRNRCIRKNAKLKAKNRRSKLRTTGYRH